MENKGIFKKLIDAQAEFKPAIKDESNPFFKSSYADLGGVWEACKDALHKQGLFVSQPLMYENGKNMLKTIIYDETGDKIESFMEIQQKEQNNMQSLGSGITYARRYSLASILGIVTEDDDGNASVGKSSPRSPQNALPSKPSTDYGKKPETQPEADLDALKSEIELPTQDYKSPEKKYTETVPGKAAMRAFFMNAKRAGFEVEKAKENVKSALKLASFTDISKEQLMNINKQMKEIADKVVEKKDETVR